MEIDIEQLFVTALVIFGTCLIVLIRMFVLI